MQLTFLGAAGTVTGSKYLIEHQGTRVMVDCGLFQGRKELRLRNWQPLPVAATEIDAVVLTHAHIDHSGYLPLLIKQGFSGPVYCSHGTQALCRVLLPDSGHLQEEDARYANRRGFSKHRPALPLYTRADAEAALTQLVPVDFDERFALGGGLGARLRPVGHILGAASVRVDDGRRSITFSGDVGRPQDPIMKPPATLMTTDWLVVESTYGDRRHEQADPLDLLADLVERVVARRSILLVPAFAVGRTQMMLYFLSQLHRSGRIPKVPVYLDSPMAIRATEIFYSHTQDHRLDQAACEAMDEVTDYARTVDESKAIDNSDGPMIVISASGMLTGGRVLHHLKRFAGDPANIILLVGFQAPGTRGEALEHGVESVKVHGDYWPVRAEVIKLDSLSAHADYAELIEWLRGMERPPARLFITHGEPEAAEGMRHHLAQELGWEAEIASQEQSETLHREDGE